MHILYAVDELAIDRYKAVFRKNEVKDGRSSDSSELGGGGGEGRERGGGG